jgi:N,N-dimethylformamidase
MTPSEADDRTEPFLFGYVSALSVIAGGSLSVHVSTSADRFDADLVRIFHADPNPAGPGMRMEPVPGIALRGIRGARHGTPMGSHVLVEQPVSFGAVDSLSLGMLIWPTILSAEPAWVMELAGPRARISLGLDASGLVLEVERDGQVACAHLPLTLRQRHWTAIEVRLNPVSGEVAVCDAQESTVLPLLAGEPLAFDRVTIARGSAGMGFNGKIEAPFIGTLRNGCWTDTARWDFAQDIPGDRAVDTGPAGLHGRMVNGPLRAVTGSRWTGAEMCWRHQPDHYAAAWFHEDDLTDCAWPESFRLQTPADLPPGLYGARLKSAAGEDIIPFVVRSAPTATKPRIVFLMPTFTYMAYANVSFGHAAKPEYRSRQESWGAWPHHADDHPEFGRSLYNRHSDGSGIALSTRLRPILNMRPGALHIFDANGSGVRHFVADTHLLDWLDRQGFDCEIITDEDLHDEGAEALAAHDILLTGTHPEYHTAQTLDALQGFRDRGGRIAYLGGNGFYWRVARGAGAPHLIELRRAEGGVRAWETEPGESCHATDGSYGGLWRRNGRPPQALVGVGFTALGGYEARPYHRCPASFDKRYAWLFAGLGEEPIGDFGLVCGGAAGYEIDRLDPDLGSPEGTVLLATSKDERYATFSPAPEDVLAPGLSRSYGSPDQLVRADMTYWEGSNGAAVFAVGSVTFCGALSQNHYRNNVSQLLHNLLTGWLCRVRGT